MTSIYIRRALLLCFLFIVPYLFAQANASTSQPVRDIRAVELLEAATQNFSTQSLRSVPRQVEISGTFSNPASPEKIEGEFTARLLGKKRYVEAHRKDHHSRMAIAGLGGKTEVDGKNRIFSVSGVIEEPSFELLPIFDHWFRFYEPESSVRLIGDVTLTGVPCEAVLVSLPARFVSGHSRTFDVTVYIRKDNGQLRAIEHGLTETSFYNPAIKTRYVYDDYQPMAGLLVPLTITRYLSGSAISIYKIKSINLQKALHAEDLTF